MNFGKAPPIALQWCSALKTKSEVLQIIDCIKGLAGLNPNHRLSKTLTGLQDEPNQTNQQYQKTLFLSVSNQLIDCVFFELHLVRFNIDHD